MNELKKLGEIELKYLLPEFLDNQARDFLIKVFYFNWEGLFLI